MQNKIKTAIIGYGRSGKFLHAAGLKGNTDAYEVVAVAGRTDKNLEQAKADFGCKTYKDYRVMLDEADLDLVIIVTRNAQHCEMACECLKAGAHVLVTKPLGINREEVETIYAVAKASSKKVFPFLPARWGTDYLRIKEIIDSGEIGEVFAIRRSVYGFATRDDWQTKTEFGGGIILNWAAHLIEPPMLLAGGKPKHLFGSCAQVLNGGDAEDIFYSIITMENGTRIHSEWSFAPKGLANWFVQGTKGCIIGNATELEIHSGEPTQPDDPTKFKDMEGSAKVRTEKVGDDIYGDPIDVYRDVAADLNGGDAYQVSQADAVRLIAAMEGIKQSQQNETLIQLP
ncbi:MAG: Gfo/Idh/MocA family protein [Lentimonas sp.]